MNSPLKAPRQASAKRGFGQKLFERSEFFCPPLGAYLTWEPEGLSVGFRHACVAPREEHAPASA
ncbi:MAG: hypothetical protein ACRCV9_20020, partial [Burkholderiaceae bacterium]